MSYVFVAVAYVAGGWEWAVIGALAFAAWWRFGSGRGAIPFSMVSGAWLLLFAISGDRRLFFPYTMQIRHTNGLHDAGSACKDGRWCQHDCRLFVAPNRVAGVS